MMATAATIFAYYTTWAILVPFFAASSPIHAWFPPREWAVRLPAFILVVGLSAIGAFVGSTIIKENQKRAQKVKLRAA
ncbi:dolichol phosphate-mannose biosynthesis regulatory [Multifurca ochricompacta]|uniref:Dolichol phosphate-mannose biosynthesis regulatory protein n=1 Tax=Multifurca ochricompacta TaxID=376703 RepID=A0AAD4QRZ9_9AGAM|nr:dolichol phosphate-mannose biosynthesis regulatory [Multifurca ochricompacta]